MEGPVAAAAWDVSLHNFSARLWEQLVHFHVMRLTDSLFLWVGATPHLRNLAVAMCSRYRRSEPAVCLRCLATPNTK
uniref:Proteasome assembly chaperone 4 n=1 Tax=Cebus imitator TaxID=2715852 RepID=A0A2K5QGZ3_CEBIM